MADRYDPRQSWQANLTHSPESDWDSEDSELNVAGDWRWCGVPVHSPLGIAAGPLLNSAWLLHYANLGFDILVYKTVRSCAHPCYELPNLVPVEASHLTEGGTTVRQSATMNGTWAVSFGMPSQAPDRWRDDVETARRNLPAGKVLVVSVVGTQDQAITDPEESLGQLAADFAQCAAWAIDAGAHGIEANFSCPNVSTADGQLFQQPIAARDVAARIRQQIGTAPLVLKIGRVTSHADAQMLVEAVSPYVNGLAMTNSISARVMDGSGRLLFDGACRGICGQATLDASVDQTKLFSEVIKESNLNLHLVGVGGISSAADVRRYIGAGATSVAMATSAMLKPTIGRQIRRNLGDNTHGVRGRP